MIQNVYADGPARWIADAFTMNRTIATKMIVMSAELRTRGSMPGAMRSEIIVRSSAGAEAAIHHLRVEERRRKITVSSGFVQEEQAVPSAGVKPRARPRLPGPPRRRRPPLRGPSFAPGRPAAA